MDTIRTTITLPADIHAEWRWEALKKRISLGEVILEKTGVKRSNKLPLEKRLKRDYAIFDRVSRSGVKLDAARAVREERDRDNA
ncbi:MAG: hypothetical protein UX91_C0007G0061 [Candidatus Amesbacteria bacterium GW2011_GWB1_47_19]|nr:MAG: hypothetical protein UW51_C0006G0118 [Candidatus Amesbacteria bacterium GW2011_GWA1_44_24]KKU31845.1 MAG: hypothetical protein UX46_C0002G0061 [Candidatus Amesbacteria bacterium GW2011_GWC1_46_24]KKU66781.1 MAG: hypothetical protein UX91_C0007G0061 [Candidatus Amesbacteria bacterium GW2011_GWB1_47_19]